MEFKRYLSAQLSEWYHHVDRKPLIVRGARQVGKTFAIRSWGRKTVENFVEINFEERPSLIQLFDQDLVVDHLLDELTLAMGVDLRKPSTLIFFDEIQEAPKALTALRYFYEKAPHLPIIAAGSLIEFVLSEISMPVGRVESLELYPLTFFEFLDAVGREELSRYIEQLPLGKAVSAVAHRELLLQLKKYFYVGGMPGVVSAYVQSSSLPEASKVHEQILTVYEDDFAKYAERADWQALRLVFQRTPAFVGDTRVKYSRFDREIRSGKIKRALLLLSTARIISKVQVVHSPKPPLKAHAKPDFFKLIFLDIGLMQSSLGVDWQRIPFNQELTTLFDGALAEQFVGQELRAHGQEKELYYWERNKHGSDAEVDYLIQSGEGIIPIEVKSGAKGTFKSLQRYVDEEQPPAAYVLSHKNYEKNDVFVYVPLYRAGQLVTRTRLLARE